MTPSAASDETAQEGGEGSSTLGIAVDPLFPPFRCAGLTGDTRQLTGVRRELQSWALGAGASADSAEDLVLAAYEALANAVEHAYPTDVWSVDLFAVRTVDSRIVVTVRDQGSWRPPPADPGFRGRGLTLMTSLADDIEIRRGPDGTTVVMWWQTSPAPAESCIGSPGTA